jgi:uncharacterized protein YecE (DUF72 family)
VLSKFVDGKRIIVGTTYLDEVSPYYYPDQSFYYVRLIGNRDLTKFRQTQREQVTIMKELYQQITLRMKTPDITDIFVIFNNHFRGFAPQDYIDFRKMLHMSYKDFHQNKNLMDFVKPSR